MRVGVGITPSGDEGASASLLQTYVRRIDFHRADQSRGGFVIVACNRGGCGDTSLNRTVVGIHAGSAQECGKISVSSAHREMKLVKAAPKEKEGRDADLERWTGENARNE